MICLTVSMELRRIIKKEITSN
ncbi:Uncharacterized protein OBRU01_20457, partial [Operophtera brumata]